MPSVQALSAPKPQYSRNQSYAIDVLLSLPFPLPLSPFLPLYISLQFDWVGWMYCFRRNASVTWSRFKWDVMELAARDRLQLFFFTSGSFLFLGALNTSLTSFNSFNSQEVISYASSLGSGFPPPHPPTSVFLKGH